MRLPCHIISRVFGSTCRPPQCPRAHPEARKCQVSRAESRKVVSGWKSISIEKKPALSEPLSIGFVEVCWVLGGNFFASLWFNQTTADGSGYSVAGRSLNNKLSTRNWKTKHFWMYTRHGVCSIEVKHAWQLEHQVVFFWLFDEKPQRKNVFRT